MANTGGVTLDPLKEEDWTAWITVAEGTDAVAEPSGRWPLSATHWDTERAVTLPAVRYIQWRAVLSTRDPLVTPVVHTVDIGRDIFRKMTMPGNVIVTDVHNPSLTYSSTGFTYQEADRLWDTAVIDRDDLKAVVKDAKSEFDAIVKLLDFVSRRWVYGDPLVEYPRWNTIDMAERAHSMGNWRHVRTVRNLSGACPDSHGISRPSCDRLRGRADMKLPRYGAMITVSGYISIRHRGPTITSITPRPAYR